MCVVAPFPPPYGGIRLQAQKLVAHLAEDGVPVYSIATNPPPPQGLAWARSIPGLRSFLCELQYLTQLVRQLPRAGVVHHLAASGFNFLVRSAPVLILAGILKKKTILNYRGGRAPEFLRRWHWCVVPLMRLADRIAVPSEFLQQTFREYGLNTTLLPNIADTGLFAWRDRRRFAPRLLVTRHLNPIYNIECLLRAFRLVQSRFPDAVLTIAGTGSEENHLRDLASRWELRGVSFCGLVAHERLPSLYDSHDVYVNSSNIDNFPGALVEAACCGLPIVSTSAGGIQHMICDRRNGILVDLNDHAALAAGVLEIVDDAAFGRSLAREARSWAEQFSWHNVGPALMRCYEMPLPTGTAQAFSLERLEETHRRELAQ